MFRLLGSQTRVGPKSVSVLGSDSDLEPVLDLSGGPSNSGLCSGTVESKTGNLIL